MGIKFEGQVLKFGTVDKCNRKFAPDCKITFPEKTPVAYNFDMNVADENLKVRRVGPNAEN